MSDVWDDTTTYGWYQYRMRQEAKKRGFRDKYYKTGSPGMYASLSDEEGLRRALIRAAAHTRIVCERDRVIASRSVALGEFVTSLRRELIDMKYHKHSYYHKDLCDTSIWSDILQLKSSSNIEPIVLRALRDAKLEINNKSSDILIEEGLQEVNNSIDGALSLLQDIQKINEEAEEILTDFKQLATEMQD